MKNQKTINDYLPKKSPDRVLIQAKIPVEVHARVKDCMAKDNLTWQDLVEASLRRYLDERKVS